MAFHVGLMKKQCEFFFVNVLNKKIGTNLNPEYDYSSCVLINGVRITQTTPASPAARNYVSFNAHFFIENIPGALCNLQLQLISYKQKKIGRQCIRKPYGCVSSAVFPLTDKGLELNIRAEDRCNGFVFNAILHKIVVLPEESYTAFFSLLTAQSFLLCLWTGSVLDALDCRYFVKHLLTLLLPTQSIFLSFIDVVLESQLQKETAATLFRLDTFCSSCISTALRIVGRDAVLYELSPVLQQLRRDKPTSVDVETFVAALRKLTPHLPYLLGAVLFRVGSAVQKQFPDELNCAKRAVSCFFILRFLSPILTFWDSTGKIIVSFLNALLCGLHFIEEFHLLDLSKSSVFNSGPARKLAKAVQEAANQASSVNFDPCSSTRAAFLMSQILDDFMRPQSLSLTFPYFYESDWLPANVVNTRTEEVENSFADYGKEEHFAMLAFHIGRVLEKQADCCPVSEAMSVMNSLKNMVETIKSC
ncbi:unnamed protein product [Enterobius vermicularis]|uniref:Ras-GAP domain-containing protein n=1 Tax=Enterobius vermicularis TaxID=51028 RepID=A0A0N4UUH0_ENTVE|nr:unnamed protein product [Enterobius vermicularis]